MAAEATERHCTHTHADQRSINRHCTVSHMRLHSAVGIFCANNISLRLLVLSFLCVLRRLVRHAWFTCYKLHWRLQCRAKAIVSFSVSRSKLFSLSLTLLYKTLIFNEYGESAVETLFRNVITSHNNFANVPLYKCRLNAAFMHFILNFQLFSDLSCL